MQQAQAAVFMAETAKRVQMLVRSTDLVESMSRYLVRPHRRDSYNNIATVHRDRGTRTIWRSPRIRSVAKQSNGAD
jgi:hypothetical protein